MGEGLKSAIKSFTSNKGYLFEYAEKLSEGIPLDSSTTIGGMTGIDTYVSIYFFLDASFKSLKNGNIEYLYRYLLQHSGQKILSLVLFGGLPWLLGAVQMPLLLGSFVSGCLPLIKPLLTLGNTVIESKIFNSAAGYAYQIIGTTIIGEFTSQQFKNLTLKEKTEKEIIKWQTKQKRKIQQFNKMTAYIEEAKYDQITDHMIQGEFNINDKIAELVNENSGLIAFLIQAIAFYAAVKKMGFFDSTFYSNASGLAEEWLDIEGTSIAYTLKSILLPIFHKSFINYLEIREKINERVNKILTEKIIPYLKEYERINKLFKYNIFKEIKIFESILIDKMKIKSLEYFTIQQIFQSITSNNVTMIVFTNFEHFSKNTLEYTDKFGLKQSITGSLTSPDTYFGVSDHEKEGHWLKAPSQVRAGPQKNNQWVPGLDDFKGYVSKLKEIIGKKQEIKNIFHEHYQKWFGKDNEKTSDDFIEFFILNLKEDGILDDGFALSDTSNLQPLLDIIRLKGESLSAHLQKKYNFFLTTDIDSINPQSIKDYYRSTEYFISIMEVKYASLSANKKYFIIKNGNEQIEFIIGKDLLFSLLPRELLPLDYAADLTSGLQKWLFIDSAYKKNLDNLKKWTVKTNTIWSNLHNFYQNAASAAYIAEFETQLASKKSLLAQVQTSGGNTDEDKLKISSLQREITELQYNIDNSLEHLSQSQINELKMQNYANIGTKDIVYQMARSLLKNYLPIDFSDLNEKIKNGHYLNLIIKSIKNYFLDLWERLNNPLHVKLNYVGYEYYNRLLSICQKKNPQDSSEECEIEAFGKLIRNTRFNLVNLDKWNSATAAEKIDFINAYNEFITTWQLDLFEVSDKGVYTLLSEEMKTELANIIAKNAEGKPKIPNASDDKDKGDDATPAPILATVNDASQNKTATAPILPQVKNVSQNKTATGAESSGPANPITPLTPEDDNSVPNDKRNLFNVYTRSVFVPSEEMGELSYFGSVSETFSSITLFFKKFLGINYDQLSFSEDHIRYFGTFGIFNLDDKDTAEELSKFRQKLKERGAAALPKVLAEIGIPNIYCTKGEDTCEYILQSFEESDDFKGITWSEVLEGDTSLTTDQVYLFFSYLQHHAFFKNNDNPFTKDLSDKLSSLNLAQMKEAIKQLHLLYTSPTQARMDIYNQIQANNNINFIFDLETLLQIANGRIVFVNIFTDKIFKTYQKGKDGEYKLENFVDYMEMQRKQIDKTNKKIKWFAENYCPEGNKKCKDEILNPKCTVLDEPNNKKKCIVGYYSLLRHLHFLQENYGEKLNEENTIQDKLMNFNKVANGTNKDTNAIILDLLNNHNLNVAEQIAFFEKHLGIERKSNQQMTYSPKKRIEYLQELITKYKTMYDSLLSSLSPTMCDNTDDNCKPLLDFLQSQWLYTIDIYEKRFETLFDIRRNLDQIDNDFKPSNGFTFASLMLSFTGTPDEFPSFISRILDEEGFKREAKGRGSQQQNIVADFNKDLNVFKSILESRKQHKKTSVDYQYATGRLSLLYKQIMEKYGKSINALTNARNSCLLSHTQTCVDIKGIFQKLQDISQSQETSKKKSALEAIQLHDEFVKLPQLISDWELNISEQKPKLKMDIVKLAIKNKQDEIVIDLVNYPMIDRCLIDCSAYHKFSSPFSKSNLPSPKDYKLYTDKLRQLFSAYGLEPKTSTLATLNTKIDMQLKLQSFESKYPTRNLKQIKAMLVEMGVIVISKNEIALEFWTAYDNLMQQLENQYNEISQGFPPNERLIKVKISTLSPIEIKGFIKQLEERRSDFRLKCSFVVKNEQAFQNDCDDITNEEKILKSYDEIMKTFNALITELHDIEIKIGIDKTIISYQTIAQLQEEIRGKNIILEKIIIEKDKLLVELNIDSSKLLRGSEQSKLDYLNAQKKIMETKYSKIMNIIGTKKSEFFKVDGIDQQLP